MSFTYSFNLKDEIEHFDRLPESTQTSIEANIAKVIYESFVVTADEDFLTARMLAQQGLDRAFYWAASQALEKYFKAFLLMRGVKVKNFGGHPVAKLYEKVLCIVPNLAATQLKPLPNINIEAEKLSQLSDLDVQGFIEDVQNFGSADNRYNTFGVKFDTVYLFALDNLVYAIREKIGVPGIYDSFRRFLPESIEIFRNHNSLFDSEYDWNSQQSTK